MAENLAPEIKNEIATTRDGRDITRGFVDAMPLLSPMDSILTTKGGGDLRIYQEILRDDQVKTCVGQRISAVTSRPWEVRAGGTKRVDKMAAEFIREQLNKLNFDNVTEKMLYGVFYGYAVAEAIWAIEDGKIVPSQIKVRDRRRFGFTPDFKLKLKTSKNPMGEDIPERKFWVFATGSDHDDEPYGLGLAHWLYWPVFFKRSGIKFWLIFLEKFGTPTTVGKYEQGTPEEQQNQLLDALRNIQQDSAVVIPKGMEADLLEATRGGTADYTSLYDRMDSAIARVVLGQTASTQGTPGRLGNDDLQSDVRLDIVKADADLVCMSLNATIVKWLTEWNFPGAALPTVWRIVEEPEDLESRAKRDTEINKLGFKPTLQYILDTYGGDWVETEAKAINASDPALAAEDFAEGDSFPDQDALDAAINALNGGDVNGALVDVLKPIIDLVQNSGPDQVLDRLAEAYPTMKTDALENLLARAFFVAEVWGRLNAS
jgi:phage gp29-like protein